MDACCLSCPGCPLPILQNHPDPTGVTGTGTGVPGTLPGTPSPTSLLQLPQCSRSQAPLVCSVMSAAQWRGTQASSTDERLMGTPSLEEDSGETAVVRASPVALFCSPGDTGTFLWLRRVGHSPAGQQQGRHCHPSSQGCPRLPAPQWGSHAISWP